MNTNQFTYRDFIIYFLTGVILIIGLFMLYLKEVNEILEENSIVLEKLEKLEILVTIAAIAIIYVMGHLIHWIDTMIMKSYIKFYNLNKKYEYKLIYWLRKIYEKLVYKQRISYQITTTIKKKGVKNLPFKSNESFWENCAELQIMNRYTSCEYWHSLNDLFKGLYVVCLIIIPIAILKGNIAISLFALIMGSMTYSRARQFSEYFVNTVIINRKIESKNN